MSGGQGPREVYRVGHFAGIGMATFGWWYLGILAIIMVFVFFLVDKFQQRKSLQAENDNGVTPVTFSLCGLISMTTFYQFLQVESVSQIGIFIVRGWLQICILYLFLFYISKVLSASGFNRFKWGTATN